MTWQPAHQPPAAQPADEPQRDEHVIRRLEAFSDIVIGFSLAQLGLSLVLPAHAIDFVLRPVGIFAFLVTFVVIVRFWWTHFKIFRHYFVPNRTLIVCNFVALASLIVQVFALQLFLHFVPLGEGMIAARIYFALFSLAYGALGIMYALGLRLRARRLTLAQRRAGLRDALGIFGAVAGCVCGNVLSTSDATVVYVSVSGHREIVASAPTTIIAFTLAGWLAGVIAGRIAPRWGVQVK